MPVTRVPARPQAPAISAAEKRQVATERRTVRSDRRLRVGLDGKEGEFSRHARVVATYRRQRRELVQAAHDEAAGCNGADDLAEPPEADGSLGCKTGADREAACEVVLAPAERGQLEALQRGMGVPEEEVAAGSKRRADAGNHGAEAVDIGHEDAARVHEVDA